MNPTDARIPTALDPPERHTLARTYRARCRRGAMASGLLNLAWPAGLLCSQWVSQRWGQPMARWQEAVWVAGLFVVYALVNFPLDLWFGYLLDRQFGLAKQGIRAWSRDWLRGVSQQGFLFLIGCGSLLLTQNLMGSAWLLTWSGVLLLLLVGLAWLEADILPPGLFHVEHQGPLVERIVDLSESLPVPVRVYTAPDLRQFNITLLGLGRRQVLMVSQAAAMLASDDLLRELIDRALVRRKWQLPLLAVLFAWVWIMAGMIAIDAMIPAEARGTPLYVVQLGLGLSFWMLLPQPLAVWVENRLIGALPADVRREWIGRNLLRPHPRWFSAGRLYASVCRLSMWTPNFTCRSPSNLLGHPHAWFIPPEGV